MWDYSLLTPGKTGCQLICGETRAPCTLLVSGGVIIKNQIVQCTARKILLLTGEDPFGWNGGNGRCARGKRLMLASAQAASYVKVRILLPAVGERGYYWLCSGRL